MTYREIYESFKKVNIDNARGEAELLIREICGELSESEKSTLEQTLSDKLAESDPADRERNEKLITAVAAYMNTQVQISGNSVIVVNNPTAE